MNSCRKGPKIKHVHYKYTVCFRTVILFFVLFYIFKIAHFQNELFQYSISASWVRTLAVVNVVFGWRLIWNGNKLTIVTNSIYIIEYNKIRLQVYIMPFLFHLQPNYSSSPQVSLYLITLAIIFTHCFITL